MACGVSPSAEAADASEWREAVEARESRPGEFAESHVEREWMDAASTSAAIIAARAALPSMEVPLRGLGGLAARGDEPFASPRARAKLKLLLGGRGPAAAAAAAEAAAAASRLTSVILKVPLLAAAPRALCVRALFLRALGELLSVVLDPHSCNVERRAACALAAEDTERLASSSLSLPRLSFGVFIRTIGTRSCGVPATSSSSELLSSLFSLPASLPFPFSLWLPFSLSCLAGG
mmetsp:Transcript_7896/g.25884  ORF Transcript_7896/g.25884 Transcript_7896/m.25884 type:complete len:235 (-) Transcript_7896:2672-3376(-)